MKAYKIDLSGFTGKVRELVSEAVQKKAFELGYKWVDGPKVQLTKYPWLYFDKDTFITKDDDDVCDENALITADAFLALSPEPRTRPMTRGEVLYMVTTTPGMVMRPKGESHLAYQAAWFGFTENTDVAGFEYAVIDKSGNPVDGWHKFEIEEA